MSTAPSATSSKRRHLHQTPHRGLTMTVGKPQGTLPAESVSIADVIRTADGPLVSERGIRLPELSSPTPPSRDFSL
ncbi:hypothetical protein [Streptomyces sp. YIM S03343]